MAKKSDNKITFEDFIAKATAKRNNRKLTEDIHVNEFGYVTFTRPSDNDILQYMNNVSRSIIWGKEGNMIGQDTVIMFEASRELIYATCPYLQNKELHEALDIVDPFDVVAEVFGVPNTIDLATKIKDAFDEDNVKDVVKN